MSAPDYAPEARAPRGIEPATSGLGPPPTPDFGVDQARLDSPDEQTAEPETVAPAASAVSRWPAGIVFAIALVAIVTLGLLAVGVSKLFTIDLSNGSAPWSESGSDDRSTDDVDSTDAAAVEAALQATIDQYKASRDNGALWKKIDDTSFNRTAVSAFLYLLTDMKLAASFGADTSDYLDRADELEQKLLNEQPLGSDIEIILEDRTFTYDGTTGEGGYTANE